MKSCDKCGKIIQVTTINRETCLCGATNNDLIQLQSQLEAEKSKRLELEKALEWLNTEERDVRWIQPEGYCVVGDKYPFLGKGNTPLEAIQNAMKTPNP